MACAVGAPVAISEHFCLSCFGRTKPHRAAWAAGEGKQESQTEREISGLRNMHVCSGAFHPAVPIPEGRGWYGDAGVHPLHVCE